MVPGPGEGEGGNGGGARVRMRDFGTAREAAKEPRHDISRGDSLKCPTAVLLRFSAAGAAGPESGRQTLAHRS